MPIHAKLVDAEGTVKTIELPDNPSDEDLTHALDGTGTLVAHRAWAGGYEVLSTIGSRVGSLIIGLPSHVDGPPARRSSCTLTDDQARELVKLVTGGGWPKSS